MNLSRSEVHVLMKLVENAIEANKQANRPYEECRSNPSVNMVALLYILQDAYMEKIHNPAA
jgi:hypothetical protein